MPADRTTIKQAVQSLTTFLRDGLVADPPTAAQPFRRVEEGDPKFNEYPRPFLSIRLERTQPVAATDGDKLVRASLRMRIVTDVLSSDPHDAMLDAVGAVDDLFDGLIAAESGVVDGADGLDDRTWSFVYPAGSSGSAVAEASCTQSIVVKVDRGANRTALPEPE